MFNLYRKLTIALAVLSIAVMLPLSVQAQGGAPRGGGPGGDIPRFVELGPKVGDLAPDLAIVDDQGNPVSIREITSDGENYSVLTLGCLT